MAQLLRYCARLTLIFNLFILLSSKFISVLVLQKFIIMEYTGMLETKTKERMQRAWKLVKGNLYVDYTLSIFCGDIFVGVGMMTD